MKATIEIGVNEIKQIIADKFNVPLSDITFTIQKDYNWRGDDNGSKLTGAKIVVDYEIKKLVGG